MAGTRLWISITFVSSFVIVLTISCYYGLLYNPENNILYIVLFQQNGRRRFHQWYHDIRQQHIQQRRDEESKRKKHQLSNDSDDVRYYHPFDDTYRRDVLPPLLVRPLQVMTADSQIDYWSSTFSKIYKKQQKVLYRHDDIDPFDYIHITSPSDSESKMQYRRLCQEYYQHVITTHDDDLTTTIDDDVTTIITIINTTSSWSWMSQQEIQMYICEDYFIIPPLLQPKLIFVSSSNTTAGTTTPTTTTTTMLFYPTSLHKRGYELYHIYPKMNPILMYYHHTKQKQHTKSIYHPFRITYIIDQTRDHDDNDHSISLSLLNETNQWWHRVIQTFEEDDHAALSLRQNIPFCLWDDITEDHSPRKMPTPLVRIVPTTTTTEMTTTISQDDISRLLSESRSQFDTNHHQYDNHNFLHWVVLIRPISSSSSLHDDHNISEQQQYNNHHSDDVYYYDNTYFRIISSYDPSYNDTATMMVSSSSSSLSNILSDLLDRYIAATCYGIPQYNVSIHSIHHIVSSSASTSQNNNHDHDESLLLYPSFHSMVSYQRQLKRSYYHVYRFFYSICQHYNISSYRVPISSDSVQLLEQSYHLLYQAAMTTTSTDHHDDDDYHLYSYRKKLLQEAYQILYRIKYGDHDDDDDDDDTNPEDYYHNIRYHQVMEPYDIPWEQYGAMLAPLVVPMLLPFLLTLMREIKRYRQLVEKKKKKKNGNHHQEGCDSGSSSNNRSDNTIIVADLPCIQDAPEQQQQPQQQVVIDDNNNDNNNDNSNSDNRTEEHKTT